MVHEARGAILNPGAQISKAGAEFNYSIYATRGQGRNIEVRGAILGPPGAGFFNYVSPGGWTCLVMHSGLPVAEGQPAETRYTSFVAWHNKKCSLTS